MADIKPQYDNKSQWDRVVAYIIPGETLYAVYDCKGAGTGFVGVSDQRIIFYDQGVFIKHKSMISIPFNHIRSSSYIPMVARSSIGMWTFLREG